MTGSGTQFTFSNPIHKSDDPSPLMEYNAWAERIKGQHSYFGKPSTAKLGPWTRRVVAKDHKQEESGSGTPSPELWKKKEESPLLLIQSADSSPVRSPYIQSADSSPVRSYYSHSSQAQTMARYRQEMLDLVRDVPETAYELSLRDLVESPKITTPPQQQQEEETVEENSEEGKMESSSKKKKKRSNKKKGKKEVRRISRSESIDMGGFFLRMFIPRLPSFLGGKRSSGDSGTCAKVSPKPGLGDGEKSTDREWWSPEFGPMTSSSGSSSSTSSTGSISSSTIRGCYSFFRTR